MLGPYELNTIITGDARELAKAIPDESIDLILTDPPYPDYLTEEYQYSENGIDFLSRFNCRQFVFWSAKCPFPLDYTSIHIWDKKTGAGSTYERIFERNGGAAYKVFRHYLINSEVAASYTRDIYTGHPSQKPAALIREIIEEYTRVGDIIFDPFVGSGTTAAVCKALGRNYLAFEINPETAALARKRVEMTQPPLFVMQPIQDSLL